MRFFLSCLLFLFDFFYRNSLRLSVYNNEKQFRLGGKMDKLFVRFPLAGLTIYWLYLLQRCKSSSQRDVRSMILNFMVKLQFWKSKKSGVPLHWNHSQVHSDPEYLLGSHLCVKYNCLKIICIWLEYLMPYNYKLFVLRIVIWSYDYLLMIIN